MFTRLKTGGFTALLWKTPRPRGPRPLRAPKSCALGAVAPPQESHRPAERPTAALRRHARAVSSNPDPDSLHSRHPVPTGPTTSVDEGRTYSLMRRSCDGGIRGGDGSMTSPPVTMR